MRLKFRLPDGFLARAGPINDDGVIEFKPGCFGEIFSEKINGGYKTITVWDVAKNLHTNLKKVRGFSLDVIYVSFLVAGYDAEVPRLYEVNRGCCQPRQYACIGSGASFAQEYMTEVLYNNELRKREVEVHLLRSVCQAALKDRGTGGQSIKVYFIKANGVKELSNDNFGNIRDSYFPGVKSAEEIVTKTQWKNNRFPELTIHLKMIEPRIHGRRINIFPRYLNSLGGLLELV
ncbi:hypothetical protein C5167_029375 [Papaver somniferum]|nr:hypothetical protein C5167_029375 [Papaver somniferum]